MNGPEDLFARNIMFYGREGFTRLQGSVVAIVGLGGVGAAAAETLARAGIGKMRLIDCDIIKPSDCNRQLIALSVNIGARKVDAAEERLNAINPGLALDCRHTFFHHDTAEELITPDLDFVVDAIDSLNPKGELIRHCIEKGFPIISALGAAGKSDPSLIRTANLDDTSGCRLARSLRRHLRARKISTHIPVVYSPEPSVDVHIDAPLATSDISETYLRGRSRRPLPSLPTIPAIFGLAAASYVLRELLNSPKSPEAP